ncbi:hypothetical protein ES332_D09G074100v1 [Gossypium tomentosum]|uniref:NADH:quinone oxidoreductase/Mrp antiporter transmembrane domain-containing protein n=1 Tax=Gossypium tomentosum TaxID=34277 RepID=A0A5D2JGF7_GOSTO|nr:hypothetical protein ES332_D09G074100v1 [Gossypium tomentosum]
MLQRYPMSSNNSLAIVVYTGPLKVTPPTQKVADDAGVALKIEQSEDRVLGLGLYGSNEPTLNFETLANQSYPVALEIIFYIGFLNSFAVKSPIIALHTWLPDTHGEAHYSSCMLLAIILLKMGAYGLVRINMELLPHEHSIFSPWLIIVGTMQIIYAASTSLAGTSYDRIRLVYLDEMGGMAVSIPKIFTMFSILSMASLALSGMSGFVVELIVLFGIITSQKYFLMPKILITFVMAIGMILTPIYSLSMSGQMFYGYKLFNAPSSYFFYSGPRKLFVSISIFLPVIGIGIYPNFILSLSGEKVETILYNYFYR